MGLPKMKQAASNNRSCGPRAVSNSNFWKRPRWIRVSNTQLLGNRPFPIPIFGNGHVGSGASCLADRLGIAVQKCSWFGKPTLIFSKIGAARVEREGEVRGRGGHREEEVNGHEGRRGQFWPAFSFGQLSVLATHPF